MSHIKTALVLYPNQLFAPELLPAVDLIFVVEEPLLFGTDRECPTAFHKQKLVLHRASMRRYVEEVLWQHDLNVEYVQLEDIETTGEILLRAQKAGAEQVFVFDPTDHAIESRLKKVLDDGVDTPFELRILPNPSFMLTRGGVRDYFADKKTPKFADFYQWQRERFNILIDKKYKPVGGKWSYELEAKKRITKGEAAPGFNGFGDSKYIAEAKKWVDANFASNPGSHENFFWPTSHDEAMQWLDDFITHRLADFSVYEDAVDAVAPLLYHSGIATPLNLGLLTPIEVIEAALRHHEKSPLELTSLEGFIRQILGWREYVRGLYVTDAIPRTDNPTATRTLSAQWWDGSTGIPPLDDIITKVNQHAYAQANERLAIIGNLMVLSEISATEMYKWFSSLFIDAYDWVVVPNVYAMTQLNNLGGTVAKPYIADSSTVVSMSHYQPDVWCDIWDGLFWDYVEHHKDALAKNTHTAQLVKQLAKINPDRRRIIGYRAQDFLTSIS